VAYAAREGVLMVAYSPFSAYPFAMRAADDPIVQVGLTLIYT
jgi:hypothetical protein